jgi:hypothetical protein
VQTVVVIAAWVLVAGFVTTAQQPADAPHKIVKSYLEIQAQLASDRFEGVKSPAQSIATEAKGLGTGGADLEKAANALEAASDIKSAREAFGALSDAVIALAKTDAWQDAASGLRLVYCSMAKRSWLQRDEQIRNPYFGTQMLTCGETRPLR